MADREVKVNIVGNSRGLSRAFRQAEKDSNSFGRRMSRGLGRGVGIVAAGFAGATVAAGAFAAYGLVKSAKAAADAEASNARLAQQLKLVGDTSAKSRAKIDKTVESLSLMSGFDDEDIQDGFTNILRTTGDVQTAMEAAAVATDLAASKPGMSVEAAGRIIAKVMGGNVGALKKYGIAVEKGMNPTEALALLQRKVGGQAEAFGNTSAGAMAKLQVATENAQEKIGAALAPALIEVANAAAKYLPGIAASISTYVGQAIMWLRANWPQIRQVLATVWDWYRTYVQAVVVPAFRAVIAGVGALVGFVRQHMPEIRAAAQAAFGWIQTNIVPTVRTVAAAVSTIVRGMATIWREHGDDIKRIVGPVFHTIKTTILGVLTILKAAVEAWLAVFRGDWSTVWNSLKTIVKTALGMLVTTALTGLRVLAAVVGIGMREVWERLKAAGADLKSWAAEKISGLKTTIVQGVEDLATKVYEAAKKIPRQIGNGIRDAAGEALGPLNSLLGKIRDKLPGSEPRDASSPLRGLGRRGGAVVRNLAAGVKAAAPVFTLAVTDTMRGAIRSGLDAVGSLTSNLGGMLGTIVAEGNGPEATRLRAIRAQQAREADARRRLELQAAIDGAETDEDRAKARQDLADYELEQEAAGLEESIANRQKSYERDLANLQANFRSGRISAGEFQVELTRLIGGETGAELGTAFADEFTGTISAIGSTIQSIIDALARAGLSIGAFASSVTGEDPAGSIGVEQASQRADALEKWRDSVKAWDARRAKQRKGLEDAKVKNAAGKLVAKYTAREVDELMEAWKRKNPSPAKPHGLALGGILRRPILAGEAGPEAVVPLSSSRGIGYLSRALEEAGATSGGNVTVVNVTVDGNQFDAREFARKLQPELNRIISVNA